MCAWILNFVSFKIEVLYGMRQKFDPKNNPQLYSVKYTCMEQFLGIAPNPAAFSD